MDCLRASALAAVFLLASAAPTLANLVTDPGFESCATVTETPPPGWMGTAECVAGVSPHSGSWAAAFFGSSTTLSQSIATTAGDSYEFSFWLQNVNSLSPNDFAAFFGADEVLHLTNAGSFPYAFEDFIVTASAASTTIDFDAVSSDEAWVVDDVSVTAVTTPVPEPSSLALIAAGLFGIALAAHRRTKEES